MNAFRTVEDEESNAIANIVPVKKFRCSLCRYMFSKEKFLLNHISFCKDVENPADRLGAGTITLKNEPCKEEIEDGLDEFVTTGPMIFPHRFCEDEGGGHNRTRSDVRFAF